MLRVEALELANDRLQIGVVALGSGEFALEPADLSIAISVARGPSTNVGGGLERGLGSVVGP